MIKARDRKAAVAIAVIAAVALAGLGAWSIQGSQQQKDAGKPLEPIIVAYSPFESCTLFLVAEDMHLFAKNGLNLTLYKSSSGAAALDDMLSGKADLAVSVSEFPLVRKVLQGSPARALAIMDTAEYIYIVARKDRGIASPSDLKGKRIGTSAGSIAEFHLGRFLFLHGLGIKDVHYVSIKTPQETSDALVEGTLDAAVLAQPYADQARHRLGTATVWPAQNNQPLYALAVSTDGWIEKHPGETARFLRALVEAEDYTSSHPAEAQAIVQRRLGFDAGYMDTAWKQNQFSVSLDQSLITAMEDEARWMIKNNLTAEKEMPDFRSCIYAKGLAEVKPESVNMIS